MKAPTFCGEIEIEGEDPPEEAENDWATKVTLEVRYLAPGHEMEALDMLDKAVADMKAQIGRFAQTNPTL